MKLSRSKRTNFLTGSLMRLFGTQSPDIGTKDHNITRLNHKDEYFRNYPVNKRHSNGIEWVAKIEMCTKKDAVAMLMDLAFSSYMGKKMDEWKEQQRIAVLTAS